jgi:hypothetical protein
MPTSSAGSGPLTWRPRRRASPNRHQVPRDPGSNPSRCSSIRIVPSRDVVQHVCSALQSVQIGRPFDHRPRSSWWQPHLFHTADDIDLKAHGGAPHPRNLKVFSSSGQRRPYRSPVEALEVHGTVAERSPLDAYRANTVQPWPAYWKLEEVALRARGCRNRPTRRSPSRA